MKQLTCIAIVFLLICGCTKENAFDCFKEAGPVTTQQRYVGQFRYAAAFSNMDVDVVQGHDCLVEVKAGRNLLTGIDTYIKNDTLYLENNNTCNFVRGYDHKIKITLTVPRIDKIINMGVGRFEILEGFVQDTLWVRAESSGDVFIRGDFKQVRTSSHGNGDIYLSGTTNEFLAYSNGINYLHASEFFVKDRLFVESVSQGQCHVNARSLYSLECNIHRSGNIYYKGQPSRITDYSTGEQKGRLLPED